MKYEAPIVPLSLILSQIKNLQVVIFKKGDLTTFFKLQSQSLTETAISVLFDDLFAFNAFLGRIEGYPSFEDIPYWEYSTCLVWCESHVMSGDSFDLTLKNARRFFGNLKSYFDYLINLGKMKECTHLEKAIKEICVGKKLKLITDIPFTGIETYTEIYQGGVGIRFDIADYWILILHTTLFDDNWTRVLEAAFGVSGERVAKVKDIQEKLEKLGKTGLRDIAYNDVTKAEADRAEAWFFNIP